MKSVKAIAALSVVAGVLGSAVGCASKPPEPFVTTEVEKVSVTIEAIEPKQRLLLLRGPAGLSSVIAGPEVKNFSQIKVGDKVEVSFIVGLAAQVNKSGSPIIPGPGSSVTYAAPLGDKPAAGISETVKTTVTIDAVDTKQNTVTFTREDGYVRVIDVVTEEGQKYIRTLKRGDKVDVTYTEAVAVAVVPGN